jgi:hypothetical protein
MPKKGLTVSKIKIGDRVVYNDKERQKFQFDTTHDEKYRNKILTGRVEAIGPEGICVDFGDNFEGHSGSLPRNFTDEFAEENYPNGFPSKEYLQSEKATLWFFDFKGAEHEFLVKDLIRIPSK